MESTKGFLASLFDFSVTALVTAVQGADSFVRFRLASPANHNRGQRNWTESPAPCRGVVSSRAVRRRYFLSTWSDSRNS
jgi:hypothetical protein